MAIARRCPKMTFSLTGEEGEETIGGVDVFKYLGWPMDQSDDNWPHVRRNIRKARQIWGWLRELLRQEVADLILSATFY